MHTFDVYRLYCCLLCLWFLVCLPWIGSRGRNQIKTKCNITLRAFRFASDRVCNIWNVYFSESFRCGGKALVLLLPPPPPGCLLGNGDRGATAQNKRRVIFNTASATNFHSLLFRFGSFFCWPRGWFWIVRTAALSDGICFWYRVLMLWSGEAWICLSRVWVHNLEPKRRAALRFPSFWVQNFALSFSRMTTSPRLYFWSWTGSPLRKERYFAYLRMLRLVVSELLFFAASK